MRWGIIASSQAQAGGAVEVLSLEDAVFDWVTAGHGATGYYKPAFGADYSGGVLSGGFSSGLGPDYQYGPTTSFVRPDGVSEFRMNYGYQNNTGLLPFTISETSILRVGVHLDGSGARTLTAAILDAQSNVLATQSLSSPYPRNLNTNPASMRFSLPAGTYTLRLTGSGDNPAFNVITICPA